MPMRDGKYEPAYRAERHQIEEWLSDELSPYDYAANWGDSYTDKDGWKKQVKLIQQIETALADPTKEVFTSNYGGWPRIWHRVLKIGIAVHWPHWKPRPAVAVEGTLGVEWYDWDTLTGVDVRYARAAPDEGAKA